MAFSGGGGGVGDRPLEKYQFKLVAQGSQHIEYAAVGRYKIAGMHYRDHTMAFPQYIANACNEKFCTGCRMGH